MKKYLILGFALLMLSARLPAQTGAVGNLTAQSTNCLTTNACLEVDIPQGMGAATIKASGTMNVVFQFEASADPLTVSLASAHWVAFSMNPSDGTAAATSATESGSNLSLAWQQNIGAYKRIRLRVSTYTSGTLAGAINLSTVAARSGGNGTGGGGTPALPFNSVQFNAAGSFGGSANLTYANTGGSCGLTPAATLTQCGTGAGSFNNLPALSEYITNDDGTWNMIFSNVTGTGNTGTTRKSFFGIIAQGAAFENDISLEYRVNNVVLGALEFGSGTTSVSLGANGKDLEVGSFGAIDPNAVSEIRTIPDGDVQVLAPTTFGLCLQGSTSGQGCLKVDATSTALTSSLPFVAPGVTSSSDGVHAGSLALLCQTTLPAVTTNSVTLVGCPAATNTAYTFQYPTAIPTTGHLFDCTVTSTNCLLHDSGVVTANVVNASSPGAGIAHFAGSTQTVTSSAIVGSDMTNATITATQLAAQYSKGSCTEVWGGSGTSFAMTSGDDAISNNSCYNDSGVTRTITALKCRSDNAANTTVVTPTFGAAGTGTAILTGTLTCGNSYAYSATGTVNSASWTTGTGIDPGMSTVGNATSIAMIVEYTF